MMWRDGVVSRNPSIRVISSLVVLMRSIVKLDAEMSPRHNWMLGVAPISAIIIVFVIKGRE